MKALTLALAPFVTALTVLSVAQPARAAVAPPAPQRLYVERNTPAYSAASKAVGARATALRSLAATPAAVWLGDWDSPTAIAGRVDSVLSDAARTRTVPVFVLYNIPDRDCGSYSGGGAVSQLAYRTWVRRAITGMKGRQAIVVVEPDSLSQLECLSPAKQSAHLALLRDAVLVLSKQRSVRVYIDAGSATYPKASTVATRLRAVAVSRARGFSLNVSSFASNSRTISYGRQISSMTGGKPFVIDTSRNGRGDTAATWCNPTGQRLGLRPTTATHVPLVDAYFWIKRPGASDGACNGGPAAGVFWQPYALGLVGVS